MKTLSVKFKPGNGYTSDFIIEQIIPKLDTRLSVVEEASRDELVVAISSFFAHGMRNYVAECSDNPLLKEILAKLVNYGWLRPDGTVKNVFRQSLPMNRLAFATVNSDPTKPKVDTVYGTRYNDGTHDEVDQEDILYVDGYPVEVWNRLYATK